MRILVILLLLSVTAFADEILNRDTVAELRYPEVQQRLAEDGFALLSESAGARGARYFHEVYESQRYADQPAFVTTDTALHYFHHIFDFALRSSEEEHLSGLLRAILVKQVEQTTSLIEESPAGPLKEALAKNLSFHAVALALLEPSWQLPPPVAQEVDRELTNIRESKRRVLSKILGYTEDYTQYRPRGHYTASERLKNYFRSMMWLGRAEFKPSEEKRAVQGLLLALTLKQSGKLEDWQRLHRITAHFSGPSDNPDPVDYLKLAEQAWGRLPSLAQVAEPDKLKLFQEAAVKLCHQKPQISNPIEREPTARVKTRPHEEGFRFMGQRFVPDSFILQRLVHPYVQRPQKPRWMPSGLDVMAVLGGGLADMIQREANNYPSYLEQLSWLQQNFSRLPPESWTGNLYWGWLNSLRPLLKQRPATYPEFMRSRNWAKKALNTALGSWTELRHDTILYAKSSMVEGGADTFIPFCLARGYVEPEPEVYQQLADLCRATDETLKAEKLSTPELEKLVQHYQRVLTKLKEIADKELAGLELSQQDYSFIRDIGRLTETVFDGVRRQDLNGAGFSESDMSLVADVHTHLSANLCLEEAVGKPDEILVSLARGGHRVVARGAVYSYYEFERPTRERLDDAAWRALLQSDQAPERPGWIQPLLVQRDSAALQQQSDQLYEAHHQLRKVPATDFKVAATRQITWDAGGAAEPRWSPLYDQVVYRSGSELKLTLADGSGNTSLPPGSVRGQSPCWMPIFCQVAFVAPEAEGQNRDLWLFEYQMDYSTQERGIEYPYPHKPLRLTSGLGDHRDPEGMMVETQDFVPENRVLFSSNRAGRYQLYLMNPKNREVKQVTDLPGDNFQPRIAPDGKSIVFTSERQGEKQIWVIAADGSSRQLARGESPCWSPDGRLVAYVSGGDIWMKPVAGGESVQLTKGPAQDGSPCWSPSYDRIVYSSNNQLWVLRLEAAP